VYSFLKAGVFLASDETDHVILVKTLPYDDILHGIIERAEPAGLLPPISGYAGD
jgi:hypothetical protein